MNQLQHFCTAAGPLPPNQPHQDAGRKGIGRPEHTRRLDAIQNRSFTLWKRISSLSRQIERHYRRLAEKVFRAHPSMSALRLMEEELVDIEQERHVCRPSCRNFARRVGRKWMWRSSRWKGSRKPVRISVRSCGSAVRRWYINSRPLRKIPGLLQFSRMPQYEGYRRGFGHYLSQVRPREPDQAQIEAGPRVLRLQRIP